MQNYENVLVSVIVPNYNGVAYLQQTINSALEQDISELEVLVIDDGSTDGSIDLLSDLCNYDSRVRMLSTQGGLGPARARNLALEKANGRYIAFLDADDFWHPFKLSSQISEMRNSNAGISCHTVRVVDGVGEAVGNRKPLTNLAYGDLIRSTVVTSSVLVDRSIVGDFRMPDIARRQDLALWLELVRKNGPMLGIQAELGAYRVHDASYSRNKVVSAYYTWLVLVRVEKMPLYRSIYYFSVYALKGVFSRMRGLN